MILHRVFLVLALLLVAASGFAQNTDIEALSGLQFNFGNPGARALAMGGAFLALADDASAAEANPAGLTILRKPELSIETRQTTVSQLFPTGGVYPFVTEADFAAHQTSISFASGVLPMGSGAVAAYFHRPLDFANAVDLQSRYQTPTFYMAPSGPVSAQECAGIVGCEAHRIYPFRTAASVELTTWGLAGGWKRGRLSLGAAVRYQQFREDAYAYRVDLDAPGAPTFAVAQTNGNALFGKSAENDLTWVIGLKWSPLPSLSAGAVFKKGASFPAPVVAGPATQELSMIGATDFHVPDSAGIGISWRATQNVTINADAVRVGYSNLTDRFLSVIEYGAEEPGNVEALEGYESHDGTELHTGIEYFIPGKIGIAFRGGWWRDPAHSIHYNAPLLTKHDVAASILFPDRRAENHYSIGIGLAFTRFQLDAGYDTSETLKQASISAVARF